MAEFIRFFKPEKVYLLLVASGSSSRYTKWMGGVEHKMREIGLPVERLHRYGHVPSQIVNAAKSTQSIICFLKKRKNPMKKALSGSVVSDVVRMSEEPVLIYKKTLLSQNDQILKSIMYATNFKYSTKTCIKYIQHKAFKARRLILLHVGKRAPDPTAEEKRLEAVHANLDQLVSDCMNGFETIEKRAVVGIGVTRKILRCAGKYEVDLLVIGKIDAGGFFGRFTGSTTEAVYNRASCSVLIIPAGR